MLKVSNLLNFKITFSLFKGKPRKNGNNLLGLPFVTHSGNHSLNSTRSQEFQIK